MTLDATNLNVPIYSVLELLKRLDNLVKLTKAGFKLFVPEVTVGTQQGQSFTGQVTSFESDSITMVHEITSQHKPSVMVLNAGNIVSITFDYDDEVNELLDPSQPLPYSADMGPLDFKRLMLKYSEEISKKVKVEIQIENMLDVKAAIIPHLCNALNLMKQSIIRITSDDLGTQSFKGHVEKIQLCEADVASFELQGKTLQFKIPSVGQDLSLSISDASEQISRLL